MPRSFRVLLLSVSMHVLVMMPLLAGEDAQSQRPVKKLILPGESFLVEKRPAFVLLPPKAKRRKPQPWIMYAPTLPGLPDRHEKWMHERFLAAGVAVAGIDIGEAYGSPRGNRLISALYKTVTEMRGFAAKPVLLGRSRGGLWMSSWAIANPDKVAGIAGIYPVLDLQSYPGLKRAAGAYEMTAAELKASLSTHNPVARIGELAKRRIPVCIIQGDSDRVVPLKPNSGKLLATYIKAGAGDLVTLIVPTGQGHNVWPGFFRSQRLVQFAIQRANSAVASVNQRPAPPRGQLITKNLSYGRDAKSQILDLYRPTVASGRLPVVVWVHGGGWKNGSKDRCPATWLVENGYAVASINYRLTDTAMWPAQINDCRSAVRWLRANSKRFGLDGDRIGVWGGSAGAHLVALLGTLDAPKNERISSRVQAVCDFYGPSDLLTMPPNVLSPGRTVDDLAKTNGAKLLGGTVRDRPELAKQASAFYQVSKDDPPFLIVHGDKDPGVPIEQSRRLHAQLKKHGVESIFHIVKGAGHGGKAFRSAEVQQVVLKFFDQHLKSSK